MKKFLISSVVASALFTTAGLADISTTGTGEFLVAPQYFANGGFETKLKLVNTSAKYSYIYRAVVREYSASKEFDFIVLLSPLDVWDAKIYECGVEKYCISSDDDSNYRKGKELTANITDFISNGKTFEKGYVEFYPIAAFDEGTNESSAQPVKKADLEKAFDQLAAGATTIDHGTPLYVSNKSVAVAADAAPGLVSGFVNIENKGLKASMTLPMTAFVNVNELGALPEAANIKLSQNSLPKYYLGPNGKQLVYNDLSVKAVTIPYENYGVNDRPYFTFWADYANEQSRSFQYLVRDMEENGIVKQEDPFSGKDPSGPNQDEIKNEMGLVKVTSLLESLGLKSNPKFKKGMVRLFDMKNDAGNEQFKVKDTNKEIPSAIVTYMSAKYVETKDGDVPSFSWTYAPVERP